MSKNLTLWRLMIYNNNPKSSTVSKTAIKMSEKIELFSIP